MYQEFFGLRELPFDLTPNPRFLVLTEGHQEALANLQYGIAARKGITLMIGESGTGKTTVIRAAIARQAESTRCVHLNNPSLTRPEFVEALARRFRLSDRASLSKAALLTELEDVLVAERARGAGSVLVVDEAQRLSPELLEEIRLLSNIETDEEKLLPIIIAGQPELEGRLDHPDLRQFKQRVALRCGLTALTRAETLGYIDGRVRAAGGVGERVMTHEAKCLVHERTQGVPRLINVVADNALLGGLAANERPVGAAMVDDVCRDVRILNTGAAASPGRPPRDEDDDAASPESDDARASRSWPELFRAGTARKRFLFF